MSIAFTLRKLECFKQVWALNTLAWNIITEHCFYFVGFLIDAMVNRDGWGHLYLIVRGEILGSVKDGLLRKLLPKMFSLIKNES